jgi:thioredoxin-related protein
MRKWLVLAALVTGSLLAGAQEKIQWMGFQEAVEACRQQPKKIFVDVYTDWCGWCKRMDQTTFADAEVVKYMNEHYYAVKFDAERNDTVRFQGYDFVCVKQPGKSKGVHQLAAAMLQNKMSYPSYVIFNEELKIIQVIPGYQETQRFLPIIQFFGEDAFKTTSWQDFIEARSNDAQKNP